jgi:uncharacterized OsmC-like protein
MSSDVKFRTTVEWTGAFPIQARARNHHMYIDEPAQAGGNDKGPTPVEYVLIGLGGCILFVGRLVANEMGLDLKSVKVTLSGTLNPAKFRGQPTNDRAGFKQIEVEIEADPNIPREKIEEWIKKVESRCPVGDNLQNPTPITFKIK